MEIDNEKIKDIILREFLFLETEYGYNSSVKIKSSEIFICSFEVKYTNTILRRDILVSYSKGLVDNIIRHTFSIVIIRLPYTGVEDFFVLEKYLKSKGLFMNGNIDNQLIESDVINRVNEISILLKNNAVEVIKGEQWYEKFYTRVD